MEEKERPSAALSWLKVKFATRQKGKVEAEYDPLSIILATVKAVC